VLKSPINDGILLPSKFIIPKEQTMTERADSGIHQTNGNGGGGGKPTPNPPYNNKVVYFDFVSGGSDLTFPLLCQIRNSGSLIEIVAIQDGNLSFDVPFYSGISILDSSSPAITLFRVASIDTFPNEDIEIFSPDNMVILPSDLTGGPPPSINSSTIIENVTPVLNSNNSMTLTITGKTTPPFSVGQLPFVFTITIGITPTTNMLDTTIVVDTPIVNPPPSLSLPEGLEALAAYILGDVTTQAIAAINQSINSQIFTQVLEAINEKASPTFSSWPPVTLTARLVRIGTSGIVMGFAIGSFGSIAEKLHLSLS
jgi:hypothetical protein